MEGGSMVTEAALDYSRYFWQGEKIRLRPMRLEDAGQRFIDSLDSPARQVLQTGIELPTSVELQKAFLEKYVGCNDVDGVIMFAVETLEGVNVGGIALHSRDDKNGLFSFGIVIGREHRGKRYAEEAVRILLKYGFWERRYQKCNSACVHTNEASIALHRRLGFVEEGRRRRQSFFNGEYYDDVLFGMTREEFDAHERSQLAVSTGHSHEARDSLSGCDHPRPPYPAHQTP
jgi:RimJ/RimL family protein N-acetyltransferase